MASRPLNKFVGAVFGVAVVITCVLLFAGSSRDVPLPSIAEALTSGGGGKGVITTEEVINGKYYGRSGNATWRGKGLLTWTARTGDLISYNTKTGDKRVIVRGDQFVTRPWKVHFSGDKENVLVAFSPQRLFRSSILARYAVHDARSGDLVRELKTGDFGEEQAFQLGVWSNDNRTVLVVFRNDLYAIRVREGDVRRVTFDGSDSIFNGIADWVFEEEIFVTTSTCVYSSGAGVYVAYLKFNDTFVDEIRYNLYGEYAGEPYFDGNYQYPQVGLVRYPKSGRRNPTVSIHVVRIGDPTCWSSQLPRTCSWDMNLNELMQSKLGIIDNFIIGHFQWLREESSFTMLVFNRIQNMSWILECSAQSRQCSVVRGTNQSNGWIDNAPLFVHRNAYVTLSSVAQSDGNEYMHVTAYTKDVINFYTKGRYSVDEIVQIGEIGGVDTLVFKAPLLSLDGSEVVIADPSQSHYYGVRIGGGKPVCLTCYGGCTFNSAKFSGGEFLNTCERAHKVSNVELVEVMGDLSVSVKVKLEENKGLEKVLDGVLLPEVEYLTIPYTLGGKRYNMSVKTIGPRGWKDGGVKMYPVVVDTYSGPNSQKVTRRLTPNDWSYSLASNQKTPVVYAIIDGIGSGRQSSSLAFEVYRGLGDKEIHDKVYAMKHLLGMYKSLDPERTLIWGWSYGGYVSAMTMGKDTEDVFKCGISVAPVVNWYYYDTMYTERYMSTPEDNPEGYNASNVLRYADNFSRKKFMLVHGNADDNVHYQQSMVLARALEQKAILFRLMSYPDENHSLGGVRLHLFRTLEDFVFNHCFRK